MDEQPYRYEFTPLAEKDLNEIFEYLSLELSAPHAAAKLIDDIEKSVELTCLFPFSHPLISNVLLRKKGYRLIVVRNFTIFYTVKDQTLVIQRVLYGKRDYERLL